MRHRSCCLSGLMLVLALGGLLLMHGIDAPGHLIAADDHRQVAHAAPEAAMSDHDAAATTATGESGGGDHHGALGHVLAMCVAVLGVASGSTVLRRLSLRSLALARAPVAAARAWAHRALDELRQPAPDRLALCILRI
jgi:hypothetical protein